MEFLCQGQLRSFGRRQCYSRGEFLWGLVCPERCVTAGLWGQGRVLGHCRSIRVPQGRDGATQTGVHWGTEATLACAWARPWLPGRGKATVAFAARCRVLLAAAEEVAFLPPRFRAAALGIGFSYFLE